MSQLNQTIASCLGYVEGIQKGLNFSDIYTEQVPRHIVDEILDRLERDLLLAFKEIKEEA